MSTRSAKDNELLIMDCLEFDTMIATPGGVLLVAFETSWNGGSHMMTPILHKIKALFGQELQIGRINVETCPQLALRFRIVRVPVFLLFKNGVLRDQIVGIVPKRDLAAKIFPLIKESPEDFSRHDGRSK